MFDIQGHGGGCCGIIHISDFWPDTQKRVEEFKQKVKEFPDDWFEDSCLDGYEADVGYYNDWGEYVERKGDKKFSCILEATLTDEQMRFWAPHLKEAGFKIVNRFLNSNSGNVVNVLHYNPAGVRHIGEAPYKW